MISLTMTLRGWYNLSMTYKLKVKNNTITLPADLALILKNTRLSVRRHRNRIVMEAMMPSVQESAAGVMLGMAGMIKGSGLPDAVLWQRKIRQEWDRSVT